MGITKPRGTEVEYKVQKVGGDDNPQFTVVMEWRGQTAIGTPLRTSEIEAEKDLEDYLEKLKKYEVSQK